MSQDSKKLDECGSVGAMRKSSVLRPFVKFLNTVMSIVIVRDIMNMGKGEKTAIDVDVCEEK